jgi:hypothetical protein
MIRWHFAAVRQSRNELWERRNDIEKAERGIVYADRYTTILTRQYGGTAWETEARPSQD